jgi:hypothetical protein
MQRARIISLMMVSGLAAWCGDSDAPPPHSLPPVLRNQDPVPNVIVRLPGPAPTPIAATLVTTTGQAELRSRALDPDDPPRPLLRHIYPPSFERDSAAFCQGMIGQWTEADARFLLGEPLRTRAAFDDNGAQDGAIYAFSDPTRHYQQLELDFNLTDGTLRTVFVYPIHLTWQEARQKWGGQVSATDANNGRRFYSYEDRRLDVLVDRAGTVISFGLY